MLLHSSPHTQMQNSRPKCYIDLEMTVITEFTSGHLLLDKINTMKAWPYFRTGQPISIFSFAIFSDKDRDEFNARLRLPLEEALGVKIGDVVTIKEMMVADRQYTGTYFDPENGCDMSDWMSLRGKTDAFRYYVLNMNEKNQGYVLIDDVVPNLEMMYVDNHVRISYINIDTIRT